MGKIKLIVVLSLTFFTSALFAQVTISGTITDAETAEPLIGVNIIVSGTTVGTVTDFDGNYSLNVPEGYTKVAFSYVGYTSQTIDIAEGGTVFNLEMGTSSVLEEVIVIGYSTMKKSDKTGAVANVTADELNKGRLEDPIQGLQGKAAGVNISKQGGDPNAGFSVNIRGAASLTTGTGPLFVVDGVPGVDPTTINPDDIESYNVLKDASSAAIYGSRGANGVIIITTKNSNIDSKKDVKVNNIEYSGYTSVDMVANRPDLLNGQQVRDFAELSGRTFIDNGANTDWLDAIYRTAISHSHTLSFTGSDANSSYRASLGANFINGVLEGTAKDRFNGRLNFTQKVIKDRVTLSARMSATIEKNDYTNYGNGISPNNTIYQAIRRSPTDPIYNDDGSFFETDRSFQYYNPVAIIEDIQNERDAKRLLGNFRIDAEVYDGLFVGVNMAYIRDDHESFYFEPSFTPSNATNGLGRREYKNQESGLIETTINYRNSFNEIHNVNLIGGHSYQKDVYDGFTAEGKDAQSDYVQSNNLEALLQLEPGSIKSYKNEALLASFFFRGVYDYNKKYFATFTIRRDGSSRFGANNEWGWFPSGSVGWNIKGEDFLKNVQAISQLKLRVGYGIAGNQDIPIGVDQRFFAPAGTAIDPETGEVVISFETSGDVNPNPDLKWEENHELNVGVDFGIFRDRLSGSIEYYRKVTKDLIYRYELPVPPNRNRFIYANAGEIRNSGIEATLQAFFVSRPNYKWKSIITLSHNKQETVKLSNDLYDLDEIKTLYVSGRGLVGGENWTQLIAPGFEIGTFFLPEYVALSEDGKFLFATEAGGVTRDVTLAERRVVGQAQPKFVGGWSNFIDLPHGIDISFSFRTMVGHDVLNVTRMVFSNPADLPTLNTLQEALDEYDRGLSSSPIVSSYYVEPASFLKLDFASIGYTIEKLKSKNIGTLRIYVSGSNLATFTKYTGTDPELSYGGFEFGRDQYDVYPKTRSFAFGINATF
jgi:iron complex outermembrane receptor protein